ncbi:SHOCT domain-containing protein [Aurantimonas sp. VKM B-3413]|uniref:SHOCT domain-containing protein n=1 Tax=Aurantimonas sp. VKM B-3413 TaxID=2779401 RepID=UPI001E43581E|nr:SHOCT domain-containing protein [Aurantimonas sp. VKM B-3413]MCB8838193.1 SHOCT domain-containing protein [Aurantimonas sp. VKM B-3413]
MDRQSSTDDAAEIGRISAATGFSEDAVRQMAEAIRFGNGTMAQFNHPELGGFGQWSHGGMLMIGDMFNNGLKGRVGFLAEQIAGALSQGRLSMRSPSSGGSSFGDAGQWWPDELGRPASSGAQNGIRYAVFPDAARLALDRGGTVSVHDTGAHRIGGVSQQQGGASTLRFSSQIGTVDADEFPIVRTAVAEEATTSARDFGASSGSPPETLTPAAPTNAAPGPSDSGASEAPQPAMPEPVMTRAEPARSGVPVESAGTATTGNEHRADDPIALLRRLAELKNEGILTEEEFAAKKAELLSRL